MNDNGEQVEGGSPRVETDAAKLPILERRFFIQPVTENTAGVSRKLLVYTNLETGGMSYIGLGTVPAQNPDDPRQWVQAEIQFPIEIPDEFVDQVVKESGDDLARIDAAILRYAFVHMDEAYCKVKDEAAANLGNQAFGSQIIVPGPGGSANKFRNRGRKAAADRRDQMGLH